MYLTRRVPPTPAGMAFKPFGQATEQNPTVMDVVTWMQKFAHQGKGDDVVRKLVEEICQDVVQGAYASEILACYYWVCGNIRYIRDPHALERVSAPRNVIERGTEDCESIATLLAAMGMACGNQMAFNICSFSNPPVPSHAFCMVMTPAGWLPLDPVANRVTADMSRRKTWSQIIPV